LNINYLIADPEYETAFRADVNRVETSNRMSVPPTAEGEVVQSHEFVNVTTNMKETLKIMLSMKFQGFFTHKMSGKQEAIEKLRDTKLYEAEQARKTAALTPGPLRAKALGEAFDPGHDLKGRHGPFLHYVSKEEEIREDNLVDSATHDLIESANQEVMRVLVVGMPRSGKSTLAKQLATRLDLVRIAPEVWIDDLLARIKDREENPPEDDLEDSKIDDEEGNGSRPPSAGSQKAPSQLGSQPGSPKSQKDGEGDGDGDRPGSSASAAAKEPEVVIVPRAKVDRWLSDLEYDVRNLLREGKALE
jgi:hypothetical protein